MPLALLASPTIALPTILMIIILIIRLDKTGWAR